jgi:hypothetical protein
VPVVGGSGVGLASADVSTAAGFGVDDGFGVEFAFGAADDWLSTLCWQTTSSRRELESLLGRRFLVGELFVSCRQSLSLLWARRGFFLGRGGGATSSPPLWQRPGKRSPQRLEEQELEQETAHRKRFVCRATPSGKELRAQVSLANSCNSARFKRMPASKFPAGKFSFGAWARQSGKASPRSNVSTPRCV